MVRSSYAKLFVILLGTIFILAATGLSMIIEGPEIIFIGMGIIGIFLIILPFTSVVRS